MLFAAAEAIIVKAAAETIAYLVLSFRAIYIAGVSNKLVAINITYDETRMLSKVEKSYTPANAPNVNKAVFKS